LESVAKRGGVLEHLETRDLHQIDRDFEIAVSWAKIHRRPLLLGEFGVDPAAGISNEERAEYARAVCHAAESHRIPWAYYQFNKGFDAFDTAYDRWIEPIREALIRC
jgi:endoglucanase